MATMVKTMLKYLIDDGGKVNQDNLIFALQKEGYLIKPTHGGINASKIARSDELYHLFLQKAPDDKMYPEFDS